MIRWLQFIRPDGLFLMGDQLRQLLELILHLLRQFLIGLSVRVSLIPIRYLFDLLGVELGIWIQSSLPIDLNMRLVALNLH